MNTSRRFVSLWRQLGIRSTVDQPKVSSVFASPDALFLTCTNNNRSRPSRKLLKSESQTKMRFLYSIVSLLIFVHHVSADEPSIRTQAVLATYRLEHPKTSGTGFIVSRPSSADQEGKELLLVTTAHTFEKMDGNRASIVLRKLGTNGEWMASPTELVIREAEKPLWHKHPKYDVAVMRLTTQKGADPYSVPLTTLANAKDWQGSQLEPGSFIRCIGFPHAAQFKPSKAGFPMTRLGCIASFPLSPFTKHPTFIVDYNVFEGDSGGPVYFAESGGSVKIIGLVQAQHFLDERFKMVYQEGLFRKRLGLAIIVNSQAILATIESLP